MTKKEEWISPTNEETEVLFQQIAAAIFPVIKPMEGGEGYPAAARRILSAIETGKKMVRAANEDFSVKHPNCKTHKYFIVIIDVVANCIAALIAGADDVTIFPSNSMAASHIISFAWVARAIQAAYSLELALDENTDLDDCGWDTAKLYGAITSKNNLLD